MRPEHHPAGRAARPEIDGLGQGRAHAVTASGLESHGFAGTRTDGMPRGTARPRWEWSFSGRGSPPRPESLKRVGAVSLDALRIGPVQRQAGEELRRHAPALAGAVSRAGAARSARGFGAQFGEQRRGAPHLGEAAR